MREKMKELKSVAQKIQKCEKYLWFKDDLQN